jgi:hypothetical protein
VVLAGEGQELHPQQRQSELQAVDFLLHDSSSPGTTVLIAPAPRSIQYTMSQDVHSQSEGINPPPPPLTDDMVDVFDTTVSPLNMSPGQIDGLDAIETPRWKRDGLSPRSESNLHLHMPGSSMAEMAFSALQYLPTPLLVLNDLKTAVMANDAMAKLLGVEDCDESEAADISKDCTDRVRGRTLSQLGIDMLEDGRLVALTLLYDSLRVTKLLLLLIVGGFGTRHC